VGYFTAASLARAESAPAAERQALRQIQMLAGDGEFGTWLLGCWPADLAIALGPCDEAREWATRALHGARARGVSGEIGIALRAQALVDGEHTDIERLRTAVTELERSEMALEHARTLVGLGAALRRRGHRTEARRPLAAGLDRPSTAAPRRSRSVLGPSYRRRGRDRADCASPAATR